MRRVVSARADGGWSLVELLVVIGISAILAAVAIPTFLLQRHQASDQSATDRLDAAAGVLGEIWAEYHTFCVAVPAATTTTNTSGGGCADASLTTAMNGLDPDVVADQAGNQTLGPTPPNPPVIQVFTSTAVEMAALASDGRCLYLDYLEAPTDQLSAGTWYGRGPALAQNGTECYMASSPVSGWWSTWGETGA
jgi:type II secretory pathway pseudopilin PulG